jgi:anti-anti-sigma factor
MRKHAIPETVVVVTEALEGAAVERWRRLLADVIALAPGRLVIDLRQAPRIDAAAIVLLLQIHRTMLRADGRLVLRAPPDTVRRMLSLGRVDHVLELDDGITVRPVEEGR